MNIIDYDVYSSQDLFDVISRTNLLGNPDIYPFAGANTRIENVSYHDLIPTQNFVLKEQIRKIHALDRFFSVQGIDIAKNNGFITFNTTQGMGTPNVLTPPLVEVIDGQPLIIDGMHRVKYWADRGQSFNAVVIRNIDQSVWPYQLPTRGGWAGVQIFDNVLPDGFVRKQKRYPTPEQNKYFFREYPFPGLIKLMREHTGR